jgi:hypothetical protein
MYSPLSTHVDQPDDLVDVTAESEPTGWLGIELDGR